MKLQVDMPELPVNQTTEASTGSKKKKLPEVAPVSKDIQELSDYLDTRITDLKAHRKKPLPGILRSIEDIWRDADREYTPHELQFEKTKVRFESDEDTGLRSRLVKVGTEEDWQSNAASPDLYVKINTAIAILAEMNPEAEFYPAARKFEKNTELAYANWKNSWEISGARQQMKNFMFNMAKYGTGVGRTYPRKIEMAKRVRTEYYKGDPDKDKYVEHNIVKFNDLCRESINPWQVWFSEMKRPGDPFSGDDWYNEKNFGWDNLVKTFSDIDLVALGVEPGMHMDEKARDTESKIVEPTDSVTVGFYENQVKDVYAVWIPSAKIVIYNSPLPNDDGKLSEWDAPWSLRDDRSPWGIGIYEIIRQDSVMYDRLMNMTMDQLTLAIYKMFFYKGTDVIGDNGQMVIAPGKGEQVSDPNAVKFLEIPGPGAESWKGLDYVQNRKDELSGVTKQLAGSFGGKTLGQDTQAKEAALERMKIPLDYIIDALQQEAYLTLSWQKQILSTPEIMEYEDWETLQGALKEMGMADDQIEKYHQEATTPTEANQLVFSDAEPDEQGKQKKFANVYKEQAYALSKDESGDLYEDSKKRFFRYGVDLPTQRLHWEGIVRIKPKSVLVPSKELEKRMKLDLFNLLNPAIQAMLNAPSHIPGLLPSLKQIVRVYDENLDDWLDEDFFKKLLADSQQPLPPKEPEPKISVAIKFETLPQAAQEEIIAKYMEIQLEPNLFIQASQAGLPASAHLRVVKKTAPASGGPAVPPGSSGGVPPPGVSQVGGGGGAPPGPAAGPEAGAPSIKPLAQIGSAPQSMAGATEGASRMISNK